MLALSRRAAPTRGYLALAVGLLCLVAAPASADSLRIDVSGERISVRVEAVPLATVLRAISRRTGVGFTGAEALTREVSVTFTGLTLEDALPKLLKDTNYMLVFEQSADGAPAALTEIVLSADSSGDSQPTAEPPPSSRAQPLRSLRELAIDDPEAALPQLRDALRVADATARIQLLDVVAMIDDPRKTALLREALADPDPKVRFFVVDLLSGFDDAASLIAPALTDDDPAVRVLAERVVEMYRGQQAGGS
ncbi:MAG TPA: hypothetical protein VGU22_06055 [Methylomirabilota bacterium]|nr:hypothetical protein [Methylomirabilota bacterium]